MRRRIQFVEIAHMEHVVLGKVDMSDISSENMPHRYRNQAIEVAAQRISKESHLKIMDEIIRKDCMDHEDTSRVKHGDESESEPEPASDSWSDSNSESESESELD